MARMQNTMPLIRIPSIWSLGLVNMHGNFICSSSSWFSALDGFSPSLPSNCCLHRYWSSTISRLQIAKGRQMSCLECDSLLQVGQQVSYSNAANNSKLCCLSLGIIYYKSINLLFPHSGLGRWAHGELSSVLLVSFSSFSGVLLFPPNVYSFILLVFVMYSIVFEGSRVGSQ